VEKTAAKAFALLEALTTREGPRGVSELARTLGLAKSNVHRLLGTLVALGYARRRSEGSYEATLRAWEIGVRVLNGLDIRRVARPHLARLAESTDETVHLSALDKGEIVYIDKIESSHPVREFTRVGDRAPAHCTATGKAMLAFGAGEPLTGPLRRFTMNTISNAGKLAGELKRVQRAGYAFNFGEYGAHVNGVAAPIADHGATVIAALAISGPAERLRPPVLKTYVPMVLATAHAISVDLGCRGSFPGWATDGNAAAPAPAGPRVPDLGTTF
jgi:DNA-binding IclR family transcriptional regulator